MITLPAFDEFIKIAIMGMPVGMVCLLILAGMVGPGDNFYD